MEFFIECEGKELKQEKKIDSFFKLLTALKQLFKEKGEMVYYQIYVRDIYGNYSPVELDLENIRWEEMEF